jgi:ketosteroid isomerase-like protein
MPKKGSAFYMAIFTVTNSKYRVTKTTNPHALTSSSHGASITVRVMLAALIAEACLLSLTASVAGDDTVSSLLKQQTDAFADASSRGNQAVMDAYLDDEVLFSGGSGTVDRDPKLDKDDSVSALLKRQTQAFRDAGQRGDTAAMTGYLDDDVLFTNEDGVVLGRSDFQGGAPAAPPKGVPSTVTVTDWVLHYSGDVAVSSFVDDQVIHYDGQVLNLKFLSVETWVKRGETWKLIGSQTIPLHQDPPAATLSSDGLNDYVGVYTAGPGFSATISRQGGAVALSTNGGKPATLSAEAHDVFFTPGLPPGYARTRIVFHRDASGRVTGYVGRRGLVFTKTGRADQQGDDAVSQQPISSPLALKDFVVHVSGDVAVATFIHQRVTYYGQVLDTKYRSTETWIKRGADWKMISSQGRELLPDPPAVSLSSDELNDYVGEYAVGSGLVVKISKDGNALTASTNGEKTVALSAEARDVFFTPGAARISIIFQRNASGRVTGYLSRREGSDLVFTKR